MEGDTISSNNSAAPFNAAIDCLMRISRLLQKIEKVSVEHTVFTDIFGIRITAGQAQHLKFRLAYQLYIQSIPLLTKEGRVSIKAQLDAIKLKFATPYNSKTGKAYHGVEVYDDKIEMYLNDIVIDIQKDLQDNGKYFMPPRKDPMRAVLER